MKTVTLKNGIVLSIRKAEKEDASGLLYYLKKIGSETDFLSFGFEGVGIDVAKEEELITRFHAAPTSVMYVGIIDGIIVTDVTLSADHRSRFSHNAELGIGVLKDYWGLGIGSIMMKELIDFAKSTNHLKNIHLTAMAENERAIGLYTKFGFKEVGRHKDYSKVDGRFLDAVEMDLQI